MHISPWPKKIGIDEHFFKRNLRSVDRERQFVTMVVDQKNKKLKEVINSRRGDELEAALAYIPGRENVEWASIDMSDFIEVSFVASFQTRPSSPTAASPMLASKASTARQSS